MEEEGSPKNNDKINNNEIFLNQTETNINKKSKLLSLNTIRSFTIKKEYDKNIKKEKDKAENFNIYDKQIFEPIYNQIHQNVKDYDEEIKTAKLFFKSSKKLQKPIFHYNFQKGNLLLDRIKKSNLKKRSINNSKPKKSLFLKTFSGNINNLYSGNIKKKVIFKNLHLNEVINNKINDNNRLVIKSYTERNRRIEDKHNDNNNNELILNIPIIKKNSNISRNIENKMISTNSLISVSQINKTLTTLSFQDNNKQNNGRIKTYYIEYDEKWYFKNKLIKPHLEKETITNPLLQKKLIDDELILVFENMKIFQSKFLVNKNLYSDFNKLSNFQQSTININLEEGIGLFIEISYLLLDKYSISIEKFISNPIKRVTKKKDKNVSNEKEEFKINTNLFYESYIFVKVSYETYKIILNNKKDFCIKKATFEILFQYLDRARFTISKICADLNMLYLEPNKDDKRLIDQCMNRIKNNHIKILNNFQTDIKKNDYSLIYSSKSFSRNRFLKKFKSKYKSKIDCHQKFGMFHTGIDSFSYKGPKRLQLTESQLMSMRINKAFYDDSKNVRLKHFPKFDINSPLVNNLMKYATYKFKSDIISERIRQRFLKSENDD